MIAFAVEEDRPTLPAWHAGFLAMLPAICECLGFAFRHLPPEARAEAMADGVAHTALSYARLYEQDRIHLAHPSALAMFAARHYRAGRRVGSRMSSGDVLSPICQRRHGIHVTSIHQGSYNEDWKEMLVEDRTCTPADLAASRIDVDDWLQRLPTKKRQIAATLAVGERTDTVAKKFSLTAGRISQMRRELADDWEDFQKEPIGNDGVCLAAC